MKSSIGLHTDAIYAARRVVWPDSEETGQPPIDTLFEGFIPDSVDIELTITPDCELNVEVLCDDPDGRLIAAVVCELNMENWPGRNWPFRDIAVWILRENTPEEIAVVKANLLRVCSTRALRTNIEYWGREDADWVREALKHVGALSEEEYLASFIREGTDEQGRSMWTCQ